MGILLRLKLRRESEHWLNDPSATLEIEKVLNPANSAQALDGKIRLVIYIFLLIGKFFIIYEENSGVCE